MLCGGPSTTVTVLQIIVVTSAFLCVDGAVNLKITNPVTQGNCSGATVDEVVRPCLDMANQIEVSSQLGSKNLSKSGDIALRKLIVRIFEGVLLTKDFDLSATTFGDLCKSISTITTCLKNTADKCKSGLATNVTNTMITKKYRYILQQLPLTGKGARATCDPLKGTVSKSFEARLKAKSVKECIIKISTKIKSDIVKVIIKIGSTAVDPSVQITASSKSGRKARAVCGKLDEVMLIFKFGSRCNAKLCNGRVVGVFGNILMRLLSTPGVKNCGKDVKDEESTEKKGKQDSKERSTINFIGLSHLRNSKLGSGFETCLMESGEVNFVNSENLVINGTMVKKANSKGKEFSYLTTLSIRMFGDKKNCGNAGDSPVKSVTFGEGVTSVKHNSKTKCGKKHVMLKTLAAKQAKSARLRVIDQCSAAAMIVRYQEVPNLGKVIYFTLRISSSIELPGELFSGCTNQVTVPGVNNTAPARRKKRSTTSPFKAVGTYDSDTSGESVMLQAAEATAEDDTAAVEADSESLGGSGSMVVATTTAVLVSLATLVLNL